ncbi:MAG: mannose-6-phosphate isomerase, class I [Acidimicrobiales bacterium]
MQVIEGIVRTYEWGSPTAIPELLGRPATGEPAAELWLGAHPSGPALVGPGGVPLDRLIAADPDGALGAEVAATFGALPFLFKVLAAAAPLSLQAHPSAAQAEAGFARENAEGIPVDAPERSFRDPRHKPELICALTEFDALCGFRDPAVTLDLFASIGVAELEPFRDTLRAEPNATGIGVVLRRLLALDAADAGSLTAVVVAACRDNVDGSFAAEKAMAASVGARYPAEAGVVIALLLNLVTLQPGDALFLGAGNLHAYLHGTGVELMANSDNVVRGGLTSKPVDVDALLEAVVTQPTDPRVQRPPVVDGIARYDSPVAEFSLSRLEVDGDLPVEAGPAVLLCTAGRADAGDHVLDRGAAVWLPASDGAITLQGRATVFRAGPGNPVPSAG